MQPSKEEISLTMSKAIQRMVKKYQDGEFERGMSRAKLELSQKDKRIEELTGFCQELEKRLKASEEQEKLFIGSREEHSDIAISINSGQATIEKSRYGTQGEATAGFVFDLLAKHLQNFLESAISKVFAIIWFIVNYDSCCCVVCPTQVLFPKQ